MSYVVPMRGSFGLVSVILASLPAAAHAAGERPAASLTSSTAIVARPAPLGETSTEDEVDTASTADRLHYDWLHPLEERLPVTVAVGFDASVGSGTFAGSRFVDDPYYASTLSLEVSRELVEDVTLSLGLALTFEWTGLVTPCHEASGPRPPGAPAQDCSGSNDPNGRIADFDDLALSLSHAHLYQLAGFVLSGRATVAAPTSRASRAATNVLTLGGGLGISRPIGRFTPSVSAGLSKYFATDDAPLAAADSGEGGIPLGRCRQVGSTACLLLAGFVPSWRFGVDLAVAVELPGAFDATVSVGYAYTGNHGRAVDARSSTRTDANGELIVDGDGAFDSTSGVVELGYAVDDGMRVALGLASSQPARTADNGGLRFPFYDFVSPANNYSAWYAAVSWNL